MRLHRLLPVMACLFPLQAIAQDNNGLCEDLYRRLGNVPKVIGNTNDVRSQSQALTQQNIEIRKLRLDMRRHECGSISITMLGGPNDAACRALRQMLNTMEQNRQDILSRRNQARSLVVSGHEADMIRADIEANNCAPRDIDSLSVSADPQNKPDGQPAPTANPPSKPKQSAIVQFKFPQDTPEPAKPRELPPVPERDYDPSRPVRLVGPRFFPNSTDIDLANPAGGGAQQRQ